MNTQEIRVCQNCKKDFVIEPEDFEFYKKINVPPPTFCPECRMIRRMTWRNERALYYRKCDLCEAKILAMYAPNKPYKVYCSLCWNSDKWDSKEYGKDYDFSKTFFEQFKELLLQVPRIALEAYQNENSPYSNYTWFSKNVYMAPTSFRAENVMHSKRSYYAKDIMDCLFVENIESCYEAINSDHSSRVATS